MRADGSEKKIVCNLYTLNFADRIWVRCKAAHKPGIKDRFSYVFVSINQTIKK